MLRSFRVLGALSIIFIATQAWAVTRVGFVDSGLSASLPRFQKYVVQGREYGVDEADHGTAVVDAFLSEAERIGMPEGELEVLVEKVDDSLHAAAAIARLVEQGAQLINISESYYFVEQNSFDLYKRAIERTAKNVLFLLSAGDEKIDLGRPRWHSTQVSRDNALVAGMVRVIPEGPAFESNYGGRIDLVLPLHPVEALGAEGAKSARAGLSFLLPAVTARAAKLRYENPRAKPSELIAGLKAASSSSRTVGRPRADVLVFPAANH